MANTNTKVTRLAGVSSALLVSDAGVLTVPTGSGMVKEYRFENNELGSCGQTELKNTAISSVAVSVCGTFIATVSNNGLLLQLWAKHMQAYNYTAITRAANFRQVSCVALALQQSISVQITETGKLLDGNTGKAPKGIVLVSCSNNGKVTLWDANTGYSLRSFDSKGYNPASMALSLNGRALVMGSDIGKASVWEVDSGRLQLRVEEKVTGIPIAVAIAPDGSTFLSGFGTTAYLWDVKENVQMQSFDGHKGQINSVAFQPHDPSYFVTGSDDHEVKLWRVGREKAVCTLGFHQNPVLSVALSLSGARLLTVSGDLINTANAIISVWEINTNTTTRSAFFGLLEEAKNNESSFTPHGLAKALAEYVSDVQELKIFYTLVSAAFRKNEITEEERNNFLREVLEQAAVTFSFDQESRVTAILQLVLKKAEEDRAITPMKKAQLAEQYTKSNVFADYRFRSLEALVKHQSERLSNLEDYVKAMDQRLRTTMKRKATIGFVCSNCWGCTQCTW